MFYAVEGTSTVLMGTMHMVPRGQIKWRDDARRAFDWAERLVFEMHTDRAKRLCEAKTEHRPIPAAFAHLISEKWPTAALGPIEGSNVPAAWLMGISQGLDVDPGPEEAMKGWAGGTEAITELEAPEDFIAAFSSVPAEDLDASMRWRFREKALSKQRFEQMYRAWRLHDVSKMLKLRNANLHPSIRRAIFDVRNEQWAPKIADFARSADRTLILVGAGHLCGQNSVLELLGRDFGLTSVRITL